MSARRPPSSMRRSAPGIVTYLRNLDVKLREFGLTPAAPAGAIQWRRDFGRPGRTSAGQPAAERASRGRRRLELLPPCHRRLGHWAGGRRQPHLDGDRRHLLRCHADVARRGRHERRPDDRRLSRLDPVDRHPYDRRGRGNHRRRRYRGDALRRPAGSGRAPGAGMLWPGRDRADRDRCAARARPSASRGLCHLLVCLSTRTQPARPSKRAWRNRSDCRSRTRPQASLRCSSRTCCTPSNTSRSSVGMRHAGLHWSRRAARARCTAPMLPGG